MDYVFCKKIWPPETFGRCKGNKPFFFMSTVAYTSVLVNVGISVASIFPLHLTSEMQRNCGVFCNCLISK